MGTLRRTEEVEYELEKQMTYRSIFLKMETTAHLWQINGTSSFSVKQSKSEENILFYMSLDTRTFKAHWRNTPSLLWLESFLLVGGRFLSSGICLYERTFVQRT